MSSEVQVFEGVAKLYADVDIQGSGLFILLNEIQAKYGYFIVVVPKILQNLFGGVTRISAIFDWSDFYNNVIVLLQSIYLLLISILLVTKKKLDLNNNIYYSAIVYCIIFAITPIVQSRYFFVISIIFAVLLSEEQDKGTQRSIACHA